MHTSRNRFRKQTLIQAGGVLALSALAGAAEAVPIYSGPENITLTVPAGADGKDYVGPTNFTTGQLDLNGDGTADFEFKLGLASDFQHVEAFIARSSNSVQLDGISNHAGDYASRFNAAGTIGSSTVHNVSTFGGDIFNTTPFHSADSQWTTATPEGYAAVLLSGGQYGWIHIGAVIPSSGTASSITIYDWGYENVPGAAIAAGAGIPSSSVPEPGTVPLMLAAGIAAALKRCFARR